MSNESGESKADTPSATLGRNRQGLHMQNDCSGGRLRQRSICEAAWGRELIDFGTKPFLGAMLRGRDSRCLGS
jgi:hypothetical protein